MSRATEVFGKFLSAIVRSLFFSGVMFIIFFSIISGTFPPDFSKLNRAFNNLQEMSKMSKEPLTVSVTEGLADSQSGLDADEKDLAMLEAYNKKRAELGEGLFGGSPTESLSPSRIFGSAKDDELKAQMRDLQQEIFRLQQRVSELEELVKEKH